MKKLAMSLLFISALAIAGSAQTTPKTSKSIQATTKPAKVVTKTSSSSSAAQANKPGSKTTVQTKTGMIKPKHKHPKVHKKSTTTK